MTSPGDLDQRVAIVTGAAGGLGSAICGEFEARGAVVVKVDISGEDCQRFDVGSKDGCEGMVSRALDLHGRIDILVLNAGAQHVAPLAEFPDCEWDRLMDVYLKGPFLAMKAAWASLTAHPNGRIIVTASTSSFLAEPYKAAYIAARHGILGLVKVAALEGAASSLTVNAVAPAWMNTTPVLRQLSEQARLMGISEEVLDTFLSRQHTKRFVRTAEAAATFAFLASTAASAITGACIPVDLGLLAW